MKLVKFNPFTPVSFNHFDRVFDDFFKANRPNYQGFNQKPLVNVVESADDFKLEVAAPGLKREDFKVSIEKDQLLISAKVEQHTEDNNGKYSRREFNYGTFQRSFYLPETVEADAIVANYENGILSVTLPKKEEEKEKGPRMVEIA